MTRLDASDADAAVAGAYGPSVLERLRRHGLSPRKSLGQNFLIEPAIADRIVAAADLTSADTVLEIGPGPGMLTERLAARARHVVAAEIDRAMVALLHAELGALTNLTIVRADILESDPGALAGGGPYKVVANLPYYITSPVLRHLLEAEVAPTLAVLMVQRDVAERICARPGDMSILAVSVQFYARPQILFTVPAEAFYPRPTVQSAVMRLDVLPAPAIALRARCDAKPLLQGGACRLRAEAQTACQQPERGDGAAQGRRYGDTSRAGHRPRTPRRNALA